MSTPSGFFTASMNALTRYFTQALEELHQVRWPTRHQAIRLTLIVVCFIAVTSIAYGLVDLLLSEFLRLTLPV